MNGWDVALLAAAAYVAITALVRLMIRRRNHLIGEFRHRMNVERRRKKARRRAEERDRQRKKAA
jgi:hypothetical protein